MELVGAYAQVLERAARVVVTVRCNERVQRHTLVSVVRAPEPVDVLRKPRHLAEACALRVGLTARAEGEPEQEHERPLTRVPVHSELLGVGPI